MEGGSGRVLRLSLLAMLVCVVCSHLWKLCNRIASVLFFIDNRQELGKVVKFKNGKITVR